MYVIHSLILRMYNNVFEKKMGDVYVQNNNANELLFSLNVW